MACDGNNCHYLAIQVGAAHPPSHICMRIVLPLPPRPQAPSTTHLAPLKRFSFQLAAPSALRARPFLVLVLISIKREPPSQGEACCEAGSCHSPTATLIENHPSLRINYSGCRESGFKEPSCDCELRLSSPPSSSHDSYFAGVFDVPDLDQLMSCSWPTPLPAV